MNFLPLSMEEVTARGWDEVDIVCVTGDAYVDHPSFGMAIVSRVLEAEGLRVALVAQPQNDADYTRYGKPRYGFFVNSGVIDSMVAHYTAGKRPRSEDAYTPGGKAGARPDRAVIVYSNRLRALYPDTPIVIGGLEASLRRFAHYDYWDDAVRPSILLDCKADLLIFGMGERQTVQIAQGLRAGKTPAELRHLRGVCYLAKQYELPQDAIMCASFHKVSVDKVAYAKTTKLTLDQQDSVTGGTLVQKHGEDYVVQNPPMPVLTTAELDAVFALPFQKTYHPSYEALGGVDAIKEVEFSLMHNRGCFGHCNFCSIAFHQGRQIAVRSKESVIAEAEAMAKNPRFKGYIHDVGGPTANFRRPSCDKQLTKGLCPDRKCLGPTPCPALKVDHSDYLDLLRSLRNIAGVKKVFVRSGVRYDYVLLDKDPSFMRELVEHHTSGQLKIAPEHFSQRVLELMGKPSIKVFERFEKLFYQTTKAVGKEQYLVPYLMSSHPGCTMEDAIELAMFLKKHRLRPEQVQDFYPTPGTVSTCMFYTGINPLTMQEVYVPRTAEEKQMQRALLQYYKPQNQREIIAALVKSGNRHLIGHGENFLVAPDAQYLKARREAIPTKITTKGKNAKTPRKQANSRKADKRR